jgi:hypothetical protein
MATPVSNFSKPLKTKVEELDYIDTITHLGKQFSNEEKKRFFDEQPNKKYKVGMIRTKELDKIVRIFTETFDFSKKVKTESSFQDVDCFKDGLTSETLAKVSETPVVKASEIPVVKLSETPVVKPSEIPEAKPSETAETSETPEAKPSETAGETPGAKPSETAEVSESLKKGAFDIDDVTQVLEHSPETILTTSDFERLYLGWMNDPKLQMSDDDKKTRRNIMKSLFRFTFGTKDISDVTATTLQKKYRIAYTPLTAEDKLPCKDSMNGVWDDFHKSLEYRRKSVMCEIFAAKDTLGESTFYTEQKKRLLLGIRDMLDILDKMIYSCMEYGYDDSQHEKEAKMDEEEYSRILKVFRTFVKDRKEKKPYSYELLLEELGKKERTPEKSKILYDQLVELLTWTEENKETDTQEELIKLKEELEDNESLIILLSLLLVLTEKIHSLELVLQEVKFKLDSTMVSKLEHEIKTYKEEYSQTVDKLRNTKVDELNQIIIELTQLLLLMNSMHSLNKSVTELQGSLNTVIKLQERLHKIPNSIVTSKANEMAEKIKTELQKQIDRKGVNPESRIGQLGGKQTGGFVQESYINMNTFCESMLTVLMTKASENKSFDLNTFMKKAGKLLDELGRTDLVLNEINHIIDASLDQIVPDEGYMFSKVLTKNQTFVNVLEEVYERIFSSEEKEILESLAPQITYHSHTPEIYQELLGTSPYFLSHGTANLDDEVILQGVEGFDEPLYMTPDERKEVEHGGIPLGALLFIYLACIKDREDLENTSIVDKCRLPTLR